LDDARGNRSDWSRVFLGRRGADASEEDGVGVRGGLRRGRGTGGGRLRPLGLLVAGSALVALSGCTSSGTPSAAPQAQAAGSGGAVSPVSKADIEILPASASTDVQVDQPVTVTASDGTLTSVVLTDTKGRPVAGSLSGDKLSWTASDPLRLAQHYRLVAAAVDSEGVGTERTGFFATVAPRKVLETSISPLSGQSVGVGMPIIVRFNATVHDRAAVEQALVVTSKKPIEGAWSWVSDTEVHFRPQEYWPAYDDVTLDVNLKGVDAGRGVWGMSSRTIKFRTGSSMVSIVNVDRHTLTVYRNGKKARVIPVTTGKADFLTRNGTKVILEKHTLKIMDASTIGISKGDPEYYRLEVPYAMRVTWSGEFVHAAPWSTGDQGRDNVSHGCVGMSMSNAIWLFNQSTVGDVVKVVGSSRPLEPGNGYTDWNVSWADWLAGSALQPQS
jgi:lipoprotein-anchoring transpeptidase ErfK/SrfK